MKDFERTEATEGKKLNKEKLLMIVVEMQCRCCLFFQVGLKIYTSKSLTFVILIQLEIFKDV